MPRLLNMSKLFFYKNFVNSTDADSSNPNINVNCAVWTSSMAIFDVSSTCTPLIDVMFLIAGGKLKNTSKDQGERTLKTIRTSTTMYAPIMRNKYSPFANVIPKTFDIVLIFALLSCIMSRILLAWRIPTTSIPTGADA